ncbi:EAL domain-containing response regulator [Rhodoplanes sp. Z2-YC6860]|uniref:EAL domain-containing response regulator n=1 Tax=Rhodoplanes sp. Z2-YC6860 TaxID=674703 RepID=UPI00078EB865|nr:EAL domain-containing response regulator [Rhodoplanes sp. Z2-YC6860]AMN44765.1 response regulator receiver modulated diguanylate phosphodiesterase [Rhodoplanes sp. Z2-YC6860]
MQGNLAGAADGSTPSLLVIDDDFVQRTIICKIGESLGYRPQSAASSEEALVALEGDQFDCITLDLSLGEQPGTNLLRTIASFRKTPVIIISGCDERIQNSAARLSSALGLGFCQVAKPINLDKLRAALRDNWPREREATRRRNTRPVIDLDQLVAAISRHEIVPWFQPKVRLGSGEVVGCEALARWKHPELGFIPPDVFIPLAEAAGLIPRLTSSLMRDAAHLASRIVGQRPKFSVAVNVSASELTDVTLFDRVEQMLADHNLPPSALTIEITESTAMSDTTKATEILVGLRLRGVGVSIDDFGTGHASLAALARMPFNELKIDNQFVRKSEIDRDMARVVRACVHLGHEFGMQVVAEGIESASLWGRMTQAGCDIAQGLAISPAIEADQFVQWVEQWGGLRTLETAAAAYA